MISRAACLSLFLVLNLLRFFTTLSEIGLFGAFGALSLIHMWFKAFSGVKRFFGVHRKHVANQGLGILRHTSPCLIIIVVDSFPHCGKDLVVVITSKWWVATEEHIHDHTCTPHVALFVITPREHLGCNIVWCARFRLQNLPRLEFA